MPPGFDDEVDGANDVVGKLSGVKVRIAALASARHTDTPPNSHLPAVLVNLANIAWFQGSMGPAFAAWGPTCLCTTQCDVFKSAPQMSAAKDDDDVDEPDPSLKMPGLREPEGEVEVLGADSIYKAALRFEDLGLSPELLKGLYQEMGFEAPSKIQAKTLPMILSKPYSHMIAQAHNGSGKTTCFVLAMLSRVDASLKHPQAICVVNARELAVQTSRVVAKMAKYTGITVCTAVPESRTVPRASRRGKIVDQARLSYRWRVQRAAVLAVSGAPWHVSICVGSASHRLCAIPYQTGRRLLSPSHLVVTLSEGSPRLILS